MGELSKVALGRDYGGIAQCCTEEDGASLGYLKWDRRANSFKDTCTVLVRHLVGVSGSVSVMLPQKVAWELGALS